MSEISLLVGTTKGLFTLNGGAGRTGWAVSGPHCDGWSINHATADPDTGRLWAGGGGSWTGAGVWSSQDGVTWDLSKLTRGDVDAMCEADPDTAAFFGWEPVEAPFEGFDSVWSLSFAHGVLRAGTRPAQHLESRDGGKTWHKNAGFAEFPERETWNPGAAGMTQHTIVTHPTDPDRLWIGVSAAGVFASEDGGQSWERRNRLANAERCADHAHPAAPSDGETGHCVHNMMRAPGEPDLLYQQNHHGVWRSADGGRSWEDLTEGLPSTFGFPIRVHPRDPDRIWTIPLNGDAEGRYPPGAAAAVWASEDGGQNWVPQRAGLPQTSCYFTVLRQAMAGDEAEPAGLYFGTNTGSVFASTDAGEHWLEVARHLPTILCVEAVARS